MILGQQCLQLLSDLQYQGVDFQAPVVVFTYETLNKTLTESSHNIA
jgi:hypothetical protein